MNNNDFDFNKHFKDFDKKFNRSFAVAGIMSVIVALAIVAIIVTGIYLAIKNWG